MGGAFACGFKVMGLKVDPSLSASYLEQRKI